MIKKIIAIICSITLSLNVGFLIYYLLNLNNIENTLRYFGIIFIFLITLLIICLNLIYSLKSGKKNLVCLVIISIISILIATGVGFLNYNLMLFNKTLNQMTSDLEKVSVSLVSLDDNVDINNIKNEKIAILNQDMSENINKLSLEMIDSLKYSNDTVTYDDIYQIADDIINNNIKYALLPANYLEMYAIYDEYVDFSENLIVNLTKEKIQEIEDSKTTNKDINEPFSILIMGVDTLANSYNADTLLVVTFNPETLTATMLSIPRDTYTTLANGAKHKINASGWGGDKSVVRTVSKYLDINIDYYFKINFVGAVSLVEAVGGIEVDVPYAFCEQNSKRKWGSNTVYVEKGLQTLNGEQALALSRNRHYWEGRCDKKYTSKGPRSDFVRGQNQQLVFKAMLNSLKNIDSLDSLYKILDTLGKNISTNMSRDTMLSFYNLGKTILDKTEGIELSEAITIQKLYFTSYFQTIRIGNMDLSTVGHYGGSIDAIKKAMKENLGLKDKDTIKKISFDINTPYKENIIGKNIYTNKNEAILMGNYVKKDISVLEKWAINNGYTLEKIEKEITDNSYVNNTIISHSPIRNVDLSTLKNKVIKVTIAKNNNSSQTPIPQFSYKQCLEEEYNEDNRCILGDFTNQPLNSIKDWVKKTGLSINITYKEVDGNDDKIISQNIKNRSLYDIITNNRVIEIEFSTKKVENPEENKNEKTDESENTNE